MLQLWQSHLFLKTVPFSLQILVYSFHGYQTMLSDSDLPSNKPLKRLSPKLGTADVCA